MLKNAISFPGRIREGAAVKVDVVGLDYRVGLDFQDVQTDETPPITGRVLVQDPATGELYAVTLEGLSVMVASDTRYSVFTNRAQALAGNSQHAPIAPGRYRVAKIGATLSIWANVSGTLVDLLAPTTYGDPDPTPPDDGDVDPDDVDGGTF